MLSYAVSVHLQQDSDRNDCYYLYMCCPVLSLCTDGKIMTVLSGSGAISAINHAVDLCVQTCQVSLEGQPFVAKAGKAFCKKHAR